MSGTEANTQARDQVALDTIGQVQGSLADRWKPIKKRVNWCGEHRSSSEFPLGKKPKQPLHRIWEVTIDGIRIKCGVEVIFSTEFFLTLF